MVVTVNKDCMGWKYHLGGNNWYRVPWNLRTKDLIIGHVKMNATRTGVAVDRVKFTRLPQHGN